MDLASRLAAAAAAGTASSDAELASLVQSLPGGDARREQACETLVARYQPVIRACVHRYSVTLDLADELTQVGYVGLMKAINNFDPELGTNLAAYARSCASGEIKRYFRDRRWQIRVRRSVQELWLEIRDATTVLTQELARLRCPPSLQSTCRSARSRSPKPSQPTAHSRQYPLMRASRTRPTRRASATCSVRTTPAWSTRWISSRSRRTGLSWMTGRSCYSPCGSTGT